MRLVLAIWLKEWAGYRRRIWSTLGFVAVLFALSLARPVADQRYVPIIAGLASALMSMKFWEERAQGTLDSLLSLPAPSRGIFLAKCSFSALVGLLVSSLVTCCVALTSALRGTALSWSLLLAIPVALVVSLGAVCIVGFVMWSLSEQASKVTQMIMFATLGGGIASVFSGGLNLLALVVFSVILLAAAGVCTALVDTERVILNLD